MNSDLLTGYRVLIKHAEDGRLLADTTILGFDAKSRVLRVDGNALKEKGAAKVLVCIVEEDGLTEVDGKLDNVMRGKELEIHLGEFRHINNRVCQRYDFFSSGEITDIVFTEQNVHLNKPIPVKTLNMSSSGILISAVPGALAVHRRFQALINLHGSMVRMSCQVVRIHSSSFLSEEYGCVILNIWRSNQAG